MLVLPCLSKSTTSLSARRAWIEIECWTALNHLSRVALRKESVDRNTDSINLSDIPANVALRKESVDRNFNAMQIVIIIVSRSPQGERG